MTDYPSQDMMRKYPVQCTGCSPVCHEPVSVLLQKWRDSDLVKVIRLESGFRASEQHHLYWYYQETEGVTDWPATTSYRMKIKTE